MERKDKWILDGQMPVAADLITWAKWMETGDRQVARTERENIAVSTVFLGLNHNFGEGPPLIFETMIFGGPNDEWQDRCSTWDEAEAMHERACKLAFPVN